MKKLSTLFVMLVMVVASLQASLWLEENFNYLDGNLEKTTAATPIELHKWIVSRKSADALGSSPIVANRNLTYTGYIGSAQGKVAVLNNTVGATTADQRISAYYMDTLRTGRSLADSTRYMAFLFKPTVAANSAGRDFVIWEGSIGSSMARGRLFLATSGTAVKLGVSKNASAPTEWSADIALNATHLIVLKYEAIAGIDNDVVKVFVNPTVNTSEAANTYKKSTDTATDMWVSAIGLRQRGTGAEIGAIRVATTWEEAMGMAAESLLLDSSVPKENEYLDPAATAITLTFNKVVSKGTGNISLTPMGGSAVQIPVSNTSILDKTVTIPVVLSANKNYQLSVPSGVFVSGALSSTAFEIDFTTIFKDPKVYVTENFEYTIATALEGQGDWQVSTATADMGGKSPLVGSTSLSYKDYAPSGLGHSLALDSVVQEVSGDVRRNTLLPLSSAAVSVNDSVYTAFMINLSHNPSTGLKDLFSYIKQGASVGTNTTMRGKIVVSIEGNNKKFSIRKNSQAIETWSAESAKDETALLVVKYINKSTASTGTADEFYVFVNPDLSKSETENHNVMIAAAGNSEDGGADLRAICFRQMKTMATVSGIRIAKTFADAAKYQPGTAVEETNASPVSIFADKGSIYYYGNEKASLSVMDMMGRLCIRTPVENGIIVTAPTQKGIYIVTLRFENGSVQSSKIVVQ